MKKVKLPEWWPKNHIHKNWHDLEIFTEKIINDSKIALTKIGISKFKPAPQDIFRHFSVTPEQIQWVVINSTPWVGTRDMTYEQLSSTQKSIFDKLEQAYGWEKAEYYLQNDLSDWPNCLLLSTSLTNVGKEIWEPLMTNLFNWFNNNGLYYCFVFLDDESFKFAKYVKKHQVFYGFFPEDIQEFLTKQWGYSFVWGLPF